MKCFCVLLALFLCLSACASGPAEVSVSTTELVVESFDASESAPGLEAESALPDDASFTVCVENESAARIHGVGFSCEIDGTALPSVLCTLQDGGWVEVGERIEQVFDKDLLPNWFPETFTAKVFVVSAGSVSYCQSEPIAFSPDPGQTYTVTLIGSEEMGYLLR